MITENEKNIIIRYAQKYNVSSLYLFGSAVETTLYHDIDLDELLKNIKEAVSLHLA